MSVAGKWRIVEFAFGACTGHIWEASSAAAVCIEFFWDGGDEMDEVREDGGAELQPDSSLHGEIRYHHGDELPFVVRKWTSSTDR